MPAVKLLYQESEGNTKPRYIMGHSVQVVSMLVAAAGSFFAVPLAGRIHQGVKFTNRDHRTLPVKFASLLDAISIGAPFISWPMPRCLQKLGAPAGGLGQPSYLATPAQRRCLCASAAVRWTAKTRLSEALWSEDQTVVAV